MISDRIIKLFTVELSHFIIAWRKLRKNGQLKLSIASFDNHYNYRQTISQNHICALVQSHILEVQVNSYTGNLIYYIML